MPLMPKRVKYRKVQRGRHAGNAYRNNKLDFGDYGLQVLDRGWITNQQIEAARVALTRHMQRRGQVWIRMFPDKPVSKKPLETRMGKGKAEPEYWVARVKPGTIVYEIVGVSPDIARKAFERVAHKMPFKCRFVEKRHA